MLRGCGMDQRRPYFASNSFALRLIAGFELIHAWAVENHAMVLRRE